MLQRNQEIKVGAAIAAAYGQGQTGIGWHRVFRVPQNAKEQWKFARLCIRRTSENHALALVFRQPAEKENLCRELSNGIYSFGMRPNVNANFRKSSNDAICQVA